LIRELEILGLTNRSWGRKTVSTAARTVIFIIILGAIAAGIYWAVAPQLDQAASPPAATETPAPVSEPAPMAPAEPAPTPPPAEPTPPPAPPAEPAPATPPAP
jgi:hypothetical protein